ncbi:hypothetical protein [Anaerorhabdus furcosa]|uniref:Uncharacterized protein n=1 Tax=Anaerorhabdus furcosa TaxID=118967 RepID=A0A1T4M094_9FIRM|nr:hypothetical protein [Anaerorhabdus furcosa]SJZ60409.1 hypothetical protein SAMN02745191_1130 [Anaerorhabdus furcosa]
MKILWEFTKKIFRQYHSSYKLIHLLIIVLSCLLFLLYINIEIEEVIRNSITFDYLGILNTIGILSTFLVLAVDKINFRELIEKYREVENVSKNFSTSQGDRLVNTFFTILISEVILLALQYVLYIFNIEFILLLFLSIFYLVIGFILIIGTWHGSEIN